MQPPAQGTPCNVVVLSDAFYRELGGHPIPVERDIVAALAHTPGLLDFYVWITWKSWTLAAYIQARPNTPALAPDGEYVANRAFADLKRLVNFGPRAPGS